MTETEILSQLLIETRRTRVILEANQSDACKPSHAAMIMGVHVRDLKQVSDKAAEFGIKLRQERGKNFVYMRNDCYKVLSLLNDGLIKIERKKS